MFAYTWPPLFKSVTQPVLSFSSLIFCYDFPILLGSLIDLFKLCKLTDVHPSHIAVKYHAG